MTKNRNTDNADFYRKSILSKGEGKPGVIEAEYEYICARREKVKKEYQKAELLKLPKQISSLGREKAHEIVKQKRFDDEKKALSSSKNDLDKLLYVLDELIYTSEDLDLERKQPQDFGRIDDAQYQQTTPDYCDWEEADLPAWISAEKKDPDLFESVKNLSTENIISEKYNIKLGWTQLKEKIIVGDELVVDKHCLDDLYELRHRTKVELENHCLQKISIDEARESVEKTIKNLFERISQKEKILYSGFSLILSGVVASVNELEEANDSKQTILNTLNSNDEGDEKKVKQWNKSLSNKIFALRSEIKNTEQPEEKQKDLEILAWGKQCLETAQKLIKLLQREIDGLNAEIQILKNKVHNQKIGSKENDLENQKRQLENVRDSIKILKATRDALEIGKASKNISADWPDEGEISYPIKIDPKHNRIGLTHSGGGIRAGTFNMGIQQGLSKYGVLPWIDYLTSISGGGFAAVTSTSLLSKKDPKNGDYYFNTQWDQFPLNPDIKVFDREKLKDCSESEDEYLAASTELGLNEQLKYLRDKGNYLAPRLGWVNRDMLRLFGWIFSSLTIIVTVFLLVMLVFSSVHYIATAALAPDIQTNYVLPTITPTPSSEPASSTNEDIITVSIQAGERQGEIKLPIDENEEIAAYAQFGGQEAQIGIPITTTQSIETAPTATPTCVSSNCVNEDEKDFSESIGFFEMLFGAPEKNPCMVAECKSEGTTPWSLYLVTIGVGAGYSVIVAFLLQIYFNRSDESKEKFKTHQKRWGNFLLICFGVSFIISSISAARLISSLKETNSSHWSYLGFPLIIILVFVLYFWRRKTQVYFGSGRTEQEHLDYFIIETSAYLSLVLMFTWIAFLKVILLMGNSPLVWKGPQVFWIWMPVLTSLGSGIGLRLFFLVYKTKVRGASRFRTLFYAYSGFHTVGFLVILVLTVLIVPHFFSTFQNGSIALSTAIISAIWAYIISTASEKVTSTSSWVLKIAALPAKIRNYVLGFLIIALNLAVIFIFEMILDRFALRLFDSVSIFGFVFSVGLVAFIILLISGRLINFNYISLHYFWRDRVGAVFMRTEIDCDDGQVKKVRDDSHLLLTAINPQGCSSPYHLVTTAVNLQGSWHLEHKDRKSQHFIFSRDYCGSKITGYVKTDQYRIGEDDKKEFYALTKFSRTIALSGAAVSSALGRVSFFAQAFIMTLFNTRLGWWMINPLLYKEIGKSNNQKILVKKYKKYEQIKKAIEKEIKKGKGNQEENLSKRLRKRILVLEKKLLWLPYLFDEAFARVNERKELVNITDGGHTGDNGAIYPLLERRCKVIIVGDASQDPEGHCEQLMNALRYAKFDLGVQVSINIENLAPIATDKDNKKAGWSHQHCAVGRIVYPQIFDSAGKELYPEEKGWLVYFKPAVTADDPAQIKEYWIRHKTQFPHPTTADQFFDEDQYEAQMLLGELSVMHTLETLIGYYEKKIKKLDDELKKQDQSDWHAEGWYEEDASLITRKNIDDEKNKINHKKTLIQRVLEKDIDFVGISTEFDPLMSDLKAALEEAA